MQFRLKAFFYHLIISVIVAITSALIVFLVLYPAPFDKAVGVTKIFLLVLMVDVIAGPLMTLVLAKEGKKGLKFDLTVIAIIQVIALSYGLYNIAINRPVWLVFDQVRFDLVLANGIDHNEDWLVKPKYKHIGLAGPNTIAVRKPIDDKERSNWLFYNMSTGYAPSMRPRFYEPLDKAWDRIAQKQLPLQDLKRFNDINLVQQQLSAYASQKITGWLPLTASNKHMTVLVNADDKKIIAVVELRPF